MSRFSKDGDTFRSGVDKKGNFSQDRVGHGTNHEHTWSKTGTNGQHKEGWHGSNAKTSDGNKKGHK